MYARETVRRTRTDVPRDCSIFDRRADAELEASDQQRMLRRLLVSRCLRCLPSHAEMQRVAISLRISTRTLGALNQRAGVKDRPGMFRNGAEENLEAPVKSLQRRRRVVTQLENTRWSLDGTGVVSPHRCESLQHPKGYERCDVNATTRRYFSARFRDTSVTYDFRVFRNRAGTQSRDNVTGILARSGPTVDPALSNTGKFQLPIG